MFDRAHARLERAGERIALPDLSARVLGVLIDRAPEPVSAAELARAAWHLEHVSEDTIAQRIALLRKALGDDPRDPAFIRTVRGRGYALMATPRPARRASPALAASLAGLVLLGGASAGALLVRPAPEPASGPVAPSEVDTLLAHARAQLGLHQREETDRAIALLRDALIRAPSDARVQTALSFALSTRVTKFGGGPDEVAEAEALARAVIERHAHDGAAWHALGYALDAQGRIGEAIAAYRQARADAPDDYAAASSAAYLLKIRGRLHEALALEAETLGATTVSLYRDLQIADALDLAGDTGRSDRFAERALLINPDHPVVLAGLATIALRRGDRAEAERLLDRAQPRERATGELARIEGRLRLLRGDEAGAREGFERAGEDGMLDALALAYRLGEEVRPVEAVIVELAVPGTTWPEYHVRLAEVAAAGGAADLALSRLHTAVDLGWRDAASLTGSPFLASLQETGALEPVLSRIRREAGAQAGLVERDEALLSRLDAALERA
ncbi:hypothetical protein E5163_04355 [Marinicauda algicola]|uniref:OmpR/PhoB-type domain-containing protein n=1 Tax=Marinicauda algicola TaxID=2029849 RepID=A0A4S2H3Z1_9PROT|nr:winged helix-turn-helix domain-containing protein [Marinicauda algicola]TGY90360.1 hypothetical protein E5163_04355 [Marinicauda algicola]